MCNAKIILQNAAIMMVSGKKELYCINTLQIKVVAPNPGTFWQVWAVRVFQ